MLRDDVPSPQLLNREPNSRVEAVLLSTASDVLKRVVNHATWAIVRCYEVQSGPVQEAPFILFRHLLELSDGIEVLVASASTVPIFPLLRASFEASLFLDFLFEDSGAFERRVTAWYSQTVRNRIKWLGRVYKYGPNSGPDTQGVLPADERVAGLSRGELEQFLESTPLLSEISAEFDRLRKARRKRPPPWYMLFGGPSNLADLAKLVSRSDEYDELYREWSPLLHGTDIDSYCRTLSNGAVVMRPLRSPELLGLGATYASKFLFGSTKLLLHHYVSESEGDECVRWWKRQIKPTLHHVRQAAQVVNQALVSSMANAKTGS